MNVLNTCIYTVYVYVLKNYLMVSLAHENMHSNTKSSGAVHGADRDLWQLGWYASVQCFIICSHTTSLILTSPIGMSSVLSASGLHCVLCVHNNISNVDQFYAT